MMKYLLAHTDLLDGNQMTVTGKTLAENLVDVPELEFENQDVVRPLENPIKETGHLTILRGSLCPGTAVAKLTGKEGLHFEVRTPYSSMNRGSLYACRVLPNALTRKFFFLNISFISIDPSFIQDRRFLPFTLCRRNQVRDCRDI